MAFRTTLAGVALFLFVKISVFAQPWAPAPNETPNVKTARARFDAYWAGKTPGRGMGVSAFRRWEWFYQSRALPDGSLPPANSTVRARSEYLAQHPQPDNGSAGNWTSLGPNVSASGYRGVGRINCVAADPKNPDILWAGAPAGGLWKSTDGGQSWTTNTDDLPVLGVTAVLIDPLNSAVMYIGTGDGFASSTPSVGVLKSTDGGQSWKPTGLDWSGTGAYNYIRYMAIHPSTQGVLLVAANVGLFRSTNGGANWSKVQDGNFYDVKFKPGNTTIAYAATNDVLYKSTDNGATWTAAQWIGNSNRLAIAVTPANPDMVAAVSSSNFGSNFNGLYVSLNSGSNYEQRSYEPNILDSSPDGSDGYAQGWYDLCIAISPLKANRIIVGGINLWKSEDGGHTWSILTSWVGPSGDPTVVHADKHALAWNGNTLLLGCDGGVYQSEDQGTSWKDLSNTLVISQMYRLGVSQADNKVICGLQDNGTKLRNNSGVWSDHVGGDGMECAIDPKQPEILYCEYQGGRLHRSTNDGQNWYDISLTIPGSGAWITPFVLDPTNPSTIYIGYQEVYKSTDRGDSWTAVSSGQSQGSQWLFVAVAPTAASTIYASNGYEIYRTNNGGGVWKQVALNLSVSNQITSLNVDPDDATKVYISLGGHTNGEKVFVSTNSGDAWTNISGGLPNLPANSVIAQPNSNGVLYLGTDIGVFRRDPLAGTWQLFSDGLPNVPVFELEIRQSTGKLRAATYGRGLWESDLAPIVNPCAAPPALPAINIEGRAATLRWDAVTDATTYTLQWRKTGDPYWTSIPNLGGVEKQLLFLTPCTQYEYRARSICPNGQSIYSEPAATFTTLGCNGYCASYADPSPPGPAAKEWIQNVRLENIDHPSGYNWGYGDFSALTAELIKDSTYEITLTPGFSSAASNQKWSVWIDWNKDKDFADAGEQILAHTAGSTDAVSVAFTVPASAAYGKTILRVSMNPSAVPEPCAAPASGGETEDYTIFTKILNPALAVAPTVLNFPAQAGSQAVTLTTNCDWTVSGQPSWLTVKPVQGAAGTALVKVIAAENVGPAVREATVLFSGCEGLVSQSVLVAQAAGAPTFNATPLLLDVASPGGCEDVSLSTNTSWTASTAAPWITSITPALGTGDALVEICFSENPEPQPRSAAVLLAPAGLPPVTVTLTQEAKTSATGAPDAGANSVRCVPNPVRGSAAFVLHSVRAQTVRLDVFSADGRRVLTLPDISLLPGETSVSWPAENLPAGLYRFRCLFENEVHGGSAVLIR